MQDMTSGHPLKLIVKFSIPLLIGNIFQQLYSISDIIIVGRLIGIKALAAVGVSAPLFFMLVLVSIGFTNGLTVITAQRFGARDYRGLRRSVTTATLLSSAFTLSAGAVMLASLDVLFKVMNVPQEEAGRCRFGSRHRLRNDGFRLLLPALHRQKISDSAPAERRLETELAVLQTAP